MDVGWKLIRIALLYMLIGLVMGLVMAISHDWTLMSVHAHLLLLGWAAMAISGIVTPSNRAARTVSWPWSISGAATSVFR